MRAIPVLTQVQCAFPTSVKGVLPEWDEIPEDFKRFNGTKWNRVVGDWFFHGLSGAKWTPKDGVDTAAALRAVAYCMGSWDPKHEHKEAGCAFLLSEWFDNVTYGEASAPTEKDSERMKTVELWVEGGDAGVAWYFCADERYFTGTARVDAPSFIVAKADLPALKIPAGKRAKVRIEVVELKTPGAAELETRYGK